MYFFWILNITSVCCKQHLFNFKSLSESELLTNSFVLSVQVHVGCWFFVYVFRIVQNAVSYCSHSFTFYRETGRLGVYQNKQTKKELIPSINSLELFCLISGIDITKSCGKKIYLCPQSTAIFSVQLLAEEVVYLCLGVRKLLSWKKCRS